MRPEGWKQEKKGLRSCGKGKGWEKTDWWWHPYLHHWTASTGIHWNGNSKWGAECTDGSEDRLSQWVLVFMCGKAQWVWRPSQESPGMSDEIWEQSCPAFTCPFSSLPGNRHHACAFSRRISRDQQGFHGHWSVSKTQLDHVLSLKYSIWTLTQQISSRTVREEGRQRKKRLLCANQLLKTLEQFSPGCPPCLQQILLPCLRCPPGRWPWECWDHTLATVSRSIQVLGIQTQLFGFAQQGLCPLDHPLSPLKFFVCLFYVYLMTVYKPGKCILLEWLCS